MSLEEKQENTHLKKESSARKRKRRKKMGM